MVDDRGLVEALRHQWALIASVAGQLDLAAPSRVRGWCNAEVLAHLTIQPVLLARAIADAEPTERDDAPGGQSRRYRYARLRGAVDAAARTGAQAGRIDFARQATAVDAAPAGADVGLTVTTLQGPIRLADYPRTRCVPGVVHGMDLQPPVVPDPTAVAAAVDALMALFHVRSPHLATACELPAVKFIDVATGRCAPPADLEDVMPLMS